MKIKIKLVVFLFPLLFIGVLFLSLSSKIAKADTSQYQQIDLGSLGGGNTKAYSINNSDQIVGQSNINDQIHHAFLWENGIMTDLGTLGGSNSIAYGINNHGQIVGESQIASNSAIHAFLRENGQMRDLGIPQEMYDFEALINEDMKLFTTTSANLVKNTVAYGINNNGDVVGKGYFDDVPRTPNINPLRNLGQRNHALLWRQNNIIDLNKDMNNIQTIYFTDSAIRSYANAINDQGQVVGSMTFPVRPTPDSLYINSEPQEAFLWENGLITDITNSPTALIESTDINNNSQITIINATNSVHPFSGFITSYIWPINSITSCSGLNLTTVELMSINKSGWFFGVKANLGGPTMGQGYFICQNGIGIDFGTYPNQDSTILGNVIIKGKINDGGSAVVDNIFFKNLRSTPTPTLTSIPTPTFTISPTLTPTNTPTLTPTSTPIPSSTPTITPTLTPSPTETPTSTPTPTPTITPITTPTKTPTPTQTLTPIPKPPTPTIFPPGLIHNKNLLTKLSDLFCRIGFQFSCHI